MRIHALQYRSRERPCVQSRGSPYILDCKFNRYDRANFVKYERSHDFGGWFYGNPRTLTSYQEFAIDFVGFFRGDGVGVSRIGASLSGIRSPLGQIKTRRHGCGLLSHHPLLRLNRFDLRRGGGGSIVRSSEEPLHVASLALGEEHQPKRGGEQRESKSSQKDVRDCNNEVVVRVSPYNDVIDPNGELRREDRFLAGIVYCIGGGLLLLMAVSYIWLLFQFRPKQRGDSTRGHDDNGKPSPPH
jgi:hypothetical protein